MMECHSSNCHAYKSPHVVILSLSHISLQLTDYPSHDDVVTCNLCSSLISGGMSVSVSKAE